MQRNIETVRSRLLDGVKLSGIARSQQENIIRATEQRSLEVSHELDRLRSRALIDRTAGDEYQRLLEEQDRLNSVLALANYPA